MESFDERKEFILTTAGKCFGYNEQQIKQRFKNVVGDKVLDEFLDSINCFILSVKQLNDFKLHFNNMVSAGDGNKMIIVFFKIRPEIVTPDNLHDIVFFSSMIDSPLTAFYYTLQRIYAPAILKDEQISQNVQSLVTDLETNLKSAVLRSSNEKSPTKSVNASSGTPSEVISVEDELQFWINVLSMGKRKSDKEKAKDFIEILKPLCSTIRDLESQQLLDLDDAIESAHNAIDDLWKLDEHRFPQTRMEHLMDIIGITVISFIQRRLKVLDLWNDAFIEIQEALNQSISACDKWCLMCERLTCLFWPHHSLHQWSGGPYKHEYLMKFSSRLKEILRIRTVSRQLTRLLTASEQQELNTRSYFSSFKDVSPLLVNQYTEPNWQIAMRQFENKVNPAEERVAAKLKTQIRSLDTNTLQLVQELNRYQDLIERPVLRQYLVTERETLLSLLQEYVTGITVDGGSIKLIDMPPVVCSLYWVHQQESKLLEIQKTGERILGDLSGWKQLNQSIESVKNELKQYHSDLFDTWTRQTGSAIAERNLGLNTDEPVVRFEQGKLMRVNYDPRLVKLVREVRQLSVLGYAIPASIVDTAHLAKGFIKQARALQQVATFHNTIGDRMITSQRPMMLAAAVDLAKLVREQHSVTWSDTAAVDMYIERLQTAVQRLYKENNKLAAYHDQILQQVTILMETDLIRQQQKWKDGLRYIRDIISQVEEQFSNMKSWCVHWDHQLYKALEHQYQIGLEAINQHLLEIKIDLVYRQQKLQFSPPMEEIRMKYYRQLKHFMSIPLNFRGVSDARIFPYIIEHNTHRFGRVFERAEQMFNKLTSLSDEWLDRVALGNVDWDALVEQHLIDAQDWDLNFRASKAWGQQIAKLPSSDIKIGCFTVSVTPVRAEIEMHNRKYWDILSSSLHSSVIRDVTTLEKFVLESRNSLEEAPQSLTEVGEANNRHQAIANAADKMVDLIESAVKKNRTLASWTKEKIEHVSQMTVMWENLQSLLNNQQLLIAKQVETMKNNLLSEAERISEDIDRFAFHWEQLRPREDNIAAVVNDSSSGHNIVDLLKEKRAQWDSLVQSTVKISGDFTHFGMDPPEFPRSNEVEEDLKHNEEIWDVYEQFMIGLSELGKEEWIVLRSRCQNKFENFLTAWTTQLTENGKSITTMSAYLLQEIQRYKDMLPIIKYLRGEMFSEKHWVELFGLLQITYKPVDQLLFSDLLPLRDIIIANSSALQDLNSRAAGEVIIRQALSDLDIWEVEAKFTLISHTDSQGNVVYLIKDFTDVMTKVGDNQCLLQSVKSSPNYENFLDRTAIWETRLTDLDNFLRMLHQVQRKWVYLEPIFGASTINVERSRFDRVDRDVRFILNEISNGDQRVVSLCRIPNLNHILQNLCQHLSYCQKNLLDFLEEKRNKFPRFYFLGDDDLLEILGQSQKQEVILSHLKKLFTGIHRVEFSDNSIISMCSINGERVPLSKPVPVSQNVEDWLSLLADEMKLTLQKLLSECLQAPTPDPLVYPAQVLCLAERVSFTKRCEDAIRHGKLTQLLSSLHAQLEEYTRQQNEWKKGSGDEIKDSSLELSTSVLQFKLKSLLMDTIYHKNLVMELVRSNVNSVEDWEWQRRLRFYNGTSNDVRKSRNILGSSTPDNRSMNSDILIVKMVDVQFEYSYEYQGNADKLVHTPLTDKCYLTLTQAMSVGLGGNPYGPAGTGKTESVKALAALLGRQVLVFNCDEGIDVQSLTRILMGLVKCGAWGCFDEFNRLEEATLSAISMQIHKIQEALRTNATNVELLGQQVPVDHKTGLFVTLNPAGRGYGGRQQLPDNLKQLFRPVAMSQPDDRLIAEVILHCEGFLHASDIAHKLVTLFKLARKLLSQQQHYDWGLRALKTVIGGCGTAIRQTKLQGDKYGEMSLVVRIVRLNILSKLTFSDCYCFDELVKDTFPGIEFESSGHDRLVKAIQDVYIELGLMHSDRQERKCVELYEQLIQRMGVVVVGSAGSGKTSVIRLLKLALSKLGSTVKQNVINPKAITRSQLLGQTDPDTRQWTDGVLSSTAQSVYNQPPDVESWIIFDGDIDPEWVESLNSVLDDNRLLTLPSGWRIQFGPNVHFLFETHDLSHASPATISRMGVILISKEEFDSKHIVESWLLKQSENEAEILARFIEDYFYRGVTWVMDHGDTVVQTSQASLIFNGLSLLPGAITIARFTYNFAAGLGSLLTSNSRESFYKQLFEWTGELLPDGVGQQLQWSHYDERRDCIEDFVYDNDRINSKSISPNTLIITGRIHAAITTLLSWLTTRQSFILLGSPGSGKSILLDHCLNLLKSQCHINLLVATIFCSAHITPHHVLQKLSQLCMVVSSSSGRIYKPKNGQHLVLHLKDINLVRADKWGTSMLTTFVQQLIMYGGFYDSHLEWVKLENVQLISSVSSTENLCSRFISLNRIYYLCSPEKGELRTIYGAYTNALVTDNKKSSLSITTAMVNIYQEVKNSLQTGLTSHNLFTPRDLTKWCVGLMRYPLHDSQCTIEALLYEALRLFKDRLICDIDKIKLNSILTSVLDTDSQWMMSSHNSQLVNSANGLLTDVYFVAEISSGKINSTAELCGPPLMKLNEPDWSALVQREIVRLGINDKLVLLPELFTLVAIIERALTSPRQSLVLAGRPGSGRKIAVRIVASRQSASIFNLKIGASYSVNNFRNDLKKAMQLAGLEGEQVYFILEDYQIISSEFLDMINSLLSSGEVPGLYQVEELENLTTSLSDLVEHNQFFGSTSQYFVNRVRDNLHVVLCFDYKNDNFKRHLNSNPAIIKHCSIVWLDNWSKQSMKIIPQTLISRETNKNVPENLLEMFILMHENNSFSDKDDINGRSSNNTTAGVNSSPRQYFALIMTYLRVMLNYENDIKERQHKLQAGVSKLNEARNVVSTLKLEAAEQERLLAEKQEKATSALEMITETMSNANVHRNQMEDLKKKTEEENKILMIRKEEIDAELIEIEPLIQEACAAVGNIKSESLSEIRSLRAPPDVIRDILEGVLRLMGIQDTSWNSMKTFLAKRGVKEDIRCFDAHKISHESRESVEQLLSERSESFVAKTAKRASVAAAPLAAWVTANVRYSKVLEKIRPLEKEQAKLERNLKLAEERINQLSTGLDDVDQTVAELKVRLNTFTREAAELEIHLNNAQDTISAAEGLVSKLDDEFSRWQHQLQELSDDLTKLPLNSLVAAAFLIYLPSSPQDCRSYTVEKWCEIVGLEQFSLLKFLSKEQHLMKWQSEGLPSDTHFIENALIILTTELCPLLIDPSSQATEWLIKHFQKEQQQSVNNKTVEVTTQANTRFQTTLELAIRFGKILIVCEVTSIDPILYPILRHDFTFQGPRKMMQVGEKLIDYNSEFKMILVSRSEEIKISPDALSLICKINFTTSPAGLTQQLLGCALKEERPELENRRTELLQQEEQLRLELYSLQEAVLRQLASADGNILQNKELLASLNETKRSSEQITNSLIESEQLQSKLNEECSVYRPLAEYASRLYFAVTSLRYINNLYCLSISAFTRLYTKTFKLSSDNENDTRCRLLLNLVYYYICRSLFRSDRLTFALYLVHEMNPQLFQNNEWELFTGQTVVESGSSSAAARSETSHLSEVVPSWIEQDRIYSVYQLKSVLPELYSKLNLDNSKLWKGFPRNNETVPVPLTLFQHVLLVQALAPDCLHTAISKFSMKALGLDTLSQPPLSLTKLLDETLPNEPILLISAQGTDPSIELRDLATTTLSDTREISLGQGQEKTAIDIVINASTNGSWVILKNLHLMIKWLPLLESELCHLTPHPNFRLWMTTQQHPNFPSTLASSCLKLTYESPQGVKRNMQSTYSSWQRLDKIYRPFFCLAWFHALVSERRMFIPQGWTKYYEFNETDITAATTSLMNIINKVDGREESIRWEYIRGLCENAIYGGRVDNPYDLRILSNYLQLMFTSNVFLNNGQVAAEIYVPHTNKISDHIKVVNKLPDVDNPVWFGLPENVDRSWQRNTSAAIINQLKVINVQNSSSGYDQGSGSEDQQDWNLYLQTQIGPLLNLWKKLNQGVPIIKEKITNITSNKSDPIHGFMSREYQFTIMLVQHIHSGLASITKLMRSSPKSNNMLGFTNDSDNSVVSLLIQPLVKHQTPEEWLKMWEGPCDPASYLRSVMTRAIAINTLHTQQQDQLYLSSIDLADIFHPDTLLNALCQQTAREKQISVGDLILKCSWDVPSSSISKQSSNKCTQLTIVGLQLEGATFNPQMQSLSPNTSYSPDVSTAPPIVIKWTKRPADEDDKNSSTTVIIPLYSAADRKNVIAELILPCRYNEQHVWMLSGTAFYIRS